MSLEPMDFQRADASHLQTWRRVCRLVGFTSIALAVLLLFLAFILL